jgi:hypothetical protein
MKKHCLANKIQLPGQPPGSSLNFGFARYMGTSPPNEEHTPDLLHQLDLAEKLMTLLVSSKVNEITMFRRTYLDKETGSEEKAENATWNRDPKTLYESQTFDVTVRSGDEQVRTVLNNIASATNLVLLVRTIRIESDKAKPTEPAKGVGGSSPSASHTGPPGTLPPPVFLPSGNQGSPAGSRQTARPPAMTAPLPAAPQGSPAPSTEAQIVMGYETVTTSLRIEVIEFRLPDEKEGKERDKSKTASTTPAKQASLQ